jgi:hypothetical protein
VLIVDPDIRLLTAKPTLDVDKQLQLAFKVPTVNLQGEGFLSIQECHKANLD